MKAIHFSKNKQRLIIVFFMLCSAGCDRSVVDAENKDISLETTAVIEKNVAPGGNTPLKGIG